VTAAEEVSKVCQQAYKDQPDRTDLHAYRYEPQEDGSCIAFWANDPSGTVKKAWFPSLAIASEWSPRDEA
jgi:hypothetical protein